MLCSTAKSIVLFKNSLEDGGPYCRLTEYGIIDCLVDKLGISQEIPDERTKMSENL